jgi:lipopolysaccharide transport system ATP-binding protein
MNDNLAIRIKDLSKQYRLGLVGTGTLSHDLKRWWTVNLLGKEDPYLKIGYTNILSSKTPHPTPHTSHPQYVWALKEINLEIKQGEVVGIIGKNGAGKSTLLKILSRVTKPTTGTIEYRGRIASLLEVGTGFHPEMTGRENIYMNGAIMGMTRQEITRKLDEIIAFAGVERYIDTPVKRYSNGMTVRLGFAVAAHLEPDILVVDEVLAVGDAEFQKKAIGKMQDVSQEGGRTVLFVSHNMAAVQNLCKKCIVLENGGVEYIGNTDDSIQHYLKDATSIKYLKNFKQRKGSGRVKLEGIKAFGEKENQQPQTGKLFQLEFSLLCQEKINLSNIRIDFRIDDYLGQRISWFSNVLKDSYASMSNYEKIVFMMEKLSLNDGIYYITYQLSLNNEILDWIQNAYSFEVIKGDYYSTGRTIPVNQGKVSMDFNVYYR